MRGWAVPSPEKQKSRRSPSLALINYHFFISTPLYTNFKSFPSSFFLIFSFCSLWSRACWTSIVRKRDVSSSSRISSSIFSFHLPSSLPRAIEPVNDADDERWTFTLPFVHLIRVLVCKSSLCAFAPYVAQYASSASPCKRNGDIETEALCRTPTFDDFSGYSLACRPCRRPGSWNPPD